MSNIMVTRLADMKAFMRRAASPSECFGISISMADAASQLMRPWRNVMRAVRYSNSWLCWRKPYERGGGTNEDRKC